jgi:hypothetical protein
MSMFHFAHLRMTDVSKVEHDFLKAENEAYQEIPPEGPMDTGTTDFRRSLTYTTD